MKKISPHNAWKTVLAEARRQLNEAENESEEKKPEEGEDSLDDQIDRYLVNFESEAKTSKTEGRDWRSTIKRLLGEAEDDEEEGDDLPDPEDIKIEKLESSSIDMSSYVNSVMRLVNNYDNLLEVRNTILRRAANFLAKTYDKETIVAYTEELSNSHGIEIGKSKRESELDKFQAPAADRAGGGGAAGP